MKRLLIAAAAAVALGLAACASSSTEMTGAPAAAPPQHTLQVAPLQYHYRQLANGLRVYAMPDPNTANVAVQVWYDVGSKDDPAGRSGFAHLFEHLMFKATRDLPAESFDRLTEDVGGFNNASTHDDYTNYYEVVPANHLQRVLWAEAERMSSLVVDDDSFHSERDVVKEELRQSVLASPYGRLFYFYLPQANYAVHPYGRPGIGSIEDLDAATTTDVRAFHAQYYRPDNAVVVVAGNFDEAQFNQWVDQYFGPIAKPARDIPRVTAVEPVRTASRDLTVYAPNVPLPAVMISYQQPPARSPDIAALTVLDAILSTGEHSRLYQSLVYEQQVAAQASTNLDENIDTGLYSLYAILSDGKTPEEGVRALRAESARLRAEPVTEQELDEAKNEIVTAALQNRETAFGRSTELADSVIRFGDPAYADRLLDAIQHVTAADVQRVAQSVLDDGKSVTVRYLPQETANGAQGDTIATAPTIQTRALSLPASEAPVFTLAPVAQRVQPPAPGPAVSAEIPPTAARTLDNGLRVIIASSHRLPLISADLRVAAGASADPAGRAGDAALTADLVTKGTTTRSATDIARQVESLGASLSADSGGDSSTVSLETRSDHVDEAFTLMADVVRNPTFAAEELERSRQQSLDGLQVALQQPRSIATFAMTRALYGATPYGGVQSPTSLHAITREDVVAFHHAYWRPDNAILVISGDVTAEQGFAIAQRYFGDWAKPAEALPAAPDAAAPAVRPRTIVVDLPHTGQAAVTMGTIGVARRDGDYFPAVVANSVLGGGYSARLNLEIRIRRGLSYGAGSGMAARLAPAPIIASAQTRNDAAVQVVGLMQTELTRLGAAPVPADELSARKASLIGSFGRAVETTSGVAGQISSLALFGLPPERLQTYVSDVSNVTPAQVQAAARRYFDPAKTTTVVVGDASVFYDGLRRQRRNAERIEIDDLNLDSATLH
ncbi:MAG TPA: pitrilysin family protein [Caulobacterales bacterium]|nr:pitrilysin family protein [Caulobacterales bacterium]